MHRQRVGLRASESRVEMRHGEHHAWHSPPQKEFTSSAFGQVPWQGRPGHAFKSQGADSDLKWPGLCRQQDTRSRGATSLPACASCKHARLAGHLYIWDSSCGIKWQGYAKDTYARSRSRVLHVGIPRCRPESGSAPSGARAHPSAAVDGCECSCTPGPHTGCNSGGGLENQNDALVMLLRQAQPTGANNHQHTQE